MRTALVTLVTFAVACSSSGTAASADAGIGPVDAGSDATGPAVDTSCVGTSALYCNDFEEPGSANALAKLASPPFDGTTSLVAGAGPTGGQVLRVHLGAGQANGALTVDETAANASIEAMFRITCSDPIAVMGFLDAAGDASGRLFSADASAGGTRAYSFGLESFDKSGTPAVISVTPTSTDWVHAAVTLTSAQVETAVEFEGAVASQKVARPAGLVAPLQAFIGPSIRTGTAVEHDCTIDYDWVRITSP